MAKPDGVSDSALHKRLRRQVAGRVRSYYAITTPGCEDVCRQEMADLEMDATGLVAEPGGVAFSGRLVDCQRANLHLRTVTRILMRIEAFSATHLRRLKKKADAIAWELFLHPGQLPDVNVASHRSRLFHTEAIAQTLRDSIARRLDSSGPLPPSPVPQTLFVRVVQDRFTLSLDSSGAPLYKRGLKAGAARAPIRETQAAAILMRAGYDPRRPLVDPLCGSGTFSLEAAMMAKQVAPGLRRDFAFMGWPAFRETQWAFLKREAQSRTTAVARPLIYASDLDADACERLAAALAANGLCDAVRVAKMDVFQLTGAMFGSRPGLVVINPPYGIRIGSAEGAAALFNDICRHLVRRFRGWKVALIAPRRDLIHRVPFAADRFPLLHGGLRLTLLIGTISAAAWPRRPAG